MLNPKQTRAHLLYSDGGHGSTTENNLLTAPSSRRDIIDAHKVKAFARFYEWIVAALPHQLSLTAGNMRGLTSCSSTGNPTPMGNAIARLPLMESGLRTMTVPGSN